MDQGKKDGFSFGITFFTWIVTEMARVVATGSTGKIGKATTIIILFSIGSGYMYQWLKGKIKINNLTGKITLAFLGTEIIAFIGVWFLTILL